MSALRAIGIGLIGAAAAALLGCASSEGARIATNTPTSGPRSAALPGDPGCFSLGAFYGSWTVLNPRELIVYVPSYSRPYLLELLEPVSNLESDADLGFEDQAHSGAICNDSIDELLVPGLRPQRIPIVAVRKLTVPEARRLLASNHIEPSSGLRPRAGKRPTMR